MRFNSDGAKTTIIIMLLLTSSRAAIERILRQTLDPGGGPSSGESAFHLSIGPALGEYPVVHAALLLIEFALGQMPL